VGHRHHKPNCRCRRPRTRVCLRKGCGRKYQPRCPNQRYCQDPECLRLLRRWQAARRQAHRRQDEAVKAQHAQAERARRRQRAPSSPQTPNSSEIAAARGHAANIFSATPICARPGCHEPAVKSGRSQGRYCCRACRQAVRRVVERERKWRLRGTFRGRRLRQQEYQASRVRRRTEPGNTNNARSAPTAPF
jgi:hypothetical protein